MKRITISVSDQIVGALKQLKKRPNVSRICSEALAGHCRAESGAKTTEEKLTAAIERFRTQKFSKTESLRTGLEEGREFVLAETADYNVIKRLVELADEFRSRKWDEIWSNVCHELPEDRRDDYLTMLDEHHLNGDEFAAGFLEGVSEVWLRIGPKVES